MISLDDSAVLAEICRHGGNEALIRFAMATLNTNLLANQARRLADMIETLPVCLCPIDQHSRCQELLDQLDWALDQLPAKAMSGRFG